MISCGQLAPKENAKPMRCLNPIICLHAPNPFKEKHFSAAENVPMF
jgi:hypothetical protein